jgi:hypothetical protein
MLQDDLWDVEVARERLKDEITTKKHGVQLEGFD